MENLINEYEYYQEMLVFTYDSDSEELWVELDFN